MEAAAREASTCTRCPRLAETRTQVVFGAGSATARLMLVGEAPGRAEDEQGTPFAGAARRLLDELITGIGLTPEDTYLTTALKCRPPGNRDPLPQEISNCQDWLHRQLEGVQPALVCPLGNFATKLLRGDPEPITRAHGRAEIRVVGGRAVRLLPLYHPSAALYTRALRETLEADFAQIPGLLALPAPEQPEPPAPEPEPEPTVDESRDDQLGLF